MSTQNGRSDEDERKLFIGGLDSSVKQENLLSYFSDYGEVEMATVKIDLQTGHSRGFGFLVFKEKSSIDAVLAQGGRHEIGGRMSEVKLATPQQNRNEGSSNKVFVGGIDKTLNKEDIKSAFQVYDITDVFLPMGSDTPGENKGFAFVTFADAAVASSLCAKGKFEVNGKEVDVKPATNKNESRGGRGGRGRGGFQGRGGYDQYGTGYGGNYGSYGYDQYGGSNYGGQGYGGQGYGGQGYSGGYDSYGGQGYGGGQSGGYGGFGQDQYKMKGGRGRGNYNPY